MLIEYTRNGRRRDVHKKVAKVLIDRGLAREVAQEAAKAALTYSTRMLTAGQGEARAHAAAGDDLDGMDVDALRQMAKDRGITVHHRAGRDKLLAALRGG
jgi:hypothetical protein